MTEYSRMIHIKKSGKAMERLLKKNAMMFVYFLGNRLIRFKLIQILN